MKNLIALLLLGMVTCGLVCGCTPKEKSNANDNASETNSGSDAGSDADSNS